MSWIGTPLARLVADLLVGRVEERGDLEAFLTESGIVGERQAEVAGAHDRHAQPPVEAQDLAQVPAQLLDVVADAAHAELAEVREVLANLRGVQMELLGERLRRDRLDAGRRRARSGTAGTPTAGWSSARRPGRVPASACSPDSQGSMLPSRAMAQPTCRRPPNRETAAPSSRMSRPRSLRPEFTLKAIVLGVLFGLLFGASTVYLGLRAGLTVSASIPIAVLAISVLKKLGGSTILENNIVQTIGSAGESLAAGVVFTIPALIFLVPLGPAYFNYFQITVLAIAGGLLGVLMMVPLRRALIVKEHGVLPYPEGTACADVLIAGERGRRAGEDGVHGPRHRRAVEGRVLDRPDLQDHHRLHVRSRQLLPERHDQPRSVAGIHGRRVRHRPPHRRRDVRRRRAFVARPAPAAVVSRQLHDRAAAAGAGQRPPDRPDERGTALERLHPLHRRRRGAGGGPDHAGPDRPDDRHVVPREREGLQRRRRARPPSRTERDMPLSDRARRLASCWPSSSSSPPARPRRATCWPPSSSCCSASSS